MPKYALLIRGINVGKNKRLAMADLRALLTGLGYADVRTHLQSGNAVFGTAKTKQDAIAAQIERAISADLGMTVRCMTRSAAEMHAVIEANPFAEFADEGSKLLAMFLSTSPEAKLLGEHDPCALDPEKVRVGDKVIYQWCPNGILEAPNVGGFVEKNLKVAVTARNWNTVTKLDALLAES
jgi:uncharacterized protein (DUF1697 family)